MDTVQTGASGDHERIRELQTHHVVIAHPDNPEQPPSPPLDTVMEFGREYQHEMDLYTRALQENARRDGNAEWREWRWMRLSAVLAVVVALQAVVLAWAVSQVGRVQTVVQVVQEDEQGRMVKLGVPRDLLAYEPPEGAWRDMVAQWVIKRHWRDEETSKERTRDDWAWLYLHSCGQTRKDLVRDEEQEKPFKPGTVRTRVDVKSVTKTVTPDSYQVLWSATSIDKYKPTEEVVTWTSTFTVGRLTPATLTDATRNHLGLCVTGVDHRKHF